MSLPKLLICVLIGTLFVLSFILWRIKKFKKVEGIASIILFLSTLFGIIFLSFDKLLISTEHNELFYYVELIIYIILYIIATLIYLIYKYKTK